MQKGNYFKSRNRQAVLKPKFLPSLFINMAVPVSFFHLDRANLDFIGPADGWTPAIVTAKIGIWNIQIFLYDIKRSSLS